MSFVHCIIPPFGNSYLVKNMYVANLYIARWQCSQRGINPIGKWKDLSALFLSIFRWTTRGINTQLFKQKKRKKKSFTNLEKKWLNTTKMMQELFVTLHDCMYLICHTRVLNRNDALHTCVYLVCHTRVLNRSDILRNCVFLTFHALISNRGDLSFISQRVLDRSDTSNNCLYVSCHKRVSGKINNLCFFHMYYIN